MTTQKIYRNSSIFIVERFIHCSLMSLCGTQSIRKPCLDLSDVGDLIMETHLIEFLYEGTNLSQHIFLLELNIIKYIEIDLNTFPTLL